MPNSEAEAAESHREPSRDWVALTLAIALATAVNLITIGVLIAAWYRGNKTGDYSLSENATQVLIAAFGGIIGVLGGYVGGRSVERATKAQQGIAAERDQMLLNAQPIPDEAAVQHVDIVGTVDVDNHEGDEPNEPPAPGS